MDEFRPDTLSKIYGQDDIVMVFLRFIKANKIPNSIFYGPPGCGKTTFAKALANDLNMDFFEFDGGSVKVDDIRKVLFKFKESVFKPIIFVDEFHRLSKTQQEILLIPMENNDAILVGATTQNPQFSISPGIRSRSMVFEFKPLSNQTMENILTDIIATLNISIDSSAKNYLVSSSGGDVRAMISLLKFANIVDGKNITLKTLKILRANPNRGGVALKDEHYSLISALIKSLRGSDVDAALYYLARLIVSGEDAEFIARRMVIFASEDVSNANPNALNLANSAMQAIGKIGYPEARIILSQLVVYLAHCPKSNSSYLAINNAIDYVNNNEKLSIPTYLINSSPDRINYLYPHDYGGYVEQKYLSKELKFYENKMVGFEKNLSEWIKKIQSIGKQ